MPGLVEIGRFDNAIDAHRVADVLSDADIEAEVFDENAGSVFPYASVFSARVVVREVDAVRARALLAATPLRALTLSSEAAALLDDETPPDEADVDDVPGAVDDGDDVPVPSVDVEAWARRTRTIAFLGLAVWVVAVVAVVRVLSPPQGLDASPTARRLLRQARWAAAASVVLIAVLVASNAIL